MTEWEYIYNSPAWEKTLDYFTKVVEDLKEHALLANTMERKEFIHGQITGIREALLFIKQQATRDEQMKEA